MSRSQEIVVEPIDLLTAKTLTVSGGAEPSTSSDAIAVGLLSRIVVFVKNAGTSTTTTVKIKGKPTSTSDMEIELKSFSLAQSGSATAKLGEVLTGFPKYIWAEATNTDAVAGHTAIITVTVDRFRL